MTKEIQLESLTINRHQWGELQGQLYGTIAFVCSEALERIAKQTANIMVTDILEGNSNKVLLTDEQMNTIEQEQDDEDKVDF